MLSLTTFLGLFIICGASTLSGSLPVVFHRFLESRHRDWLESFGGGVMSGASVFSLFLPAYVLLQEQQESLWPLASATLTGIIFITGSNWLLSQWTSSAARHRAYMIVMVMGLHNIPEGLAVGVNVAALGWSDSRSLNVAIFIQNVPEGLVSSMSFLMAGFGLTAAIAANAVTALVEVVAAVVGYLGMTRTDGNLPFMLAFAGASMLSVVGLECWRLLKAAGEANFPAWASVLVLF
jgi:zinc transporter, ZIP family